MNVLSLFDGISAAKLALINAQINVNNYYASEIDKFCIKISEKKFPDIIQLGDVKKLELQNLPQIDLLIGGSPCQDLSNAFKGSGLDGSRSSLFYEFVKIKKKIKPKFFILENVKNKWKKLMDDLLEEEGVIINSMNFSPQSRPRCYWSNIPINIPNKESKSLIKNIIEENPDKKYFFNQKLLSNFDNKNIIQNTKYEINKIFDIPNSLLRDNERQRRVYSIYGKSPTLLARSDTPKIIDNGKLRKLTPLECERLQGLPDDYTAGISDTQRYKAIGNSFSVPVITSILKNMNHKKTKQLRLIL